MNEITTRSEPRYSASTQQSLAGELAKMFALVAPVTMSADQTTAWLATAVDTLEGIRADEVAAVSLEVRRSVTRPPQIIPKIVELVSARRSHESRIRRDAPVLEGPPPKRHIADRDRREFGPSDWAELNEYLEKMGSPVRYSSDGKKL